ncbi:Xaa-Pro dipeptidase [Anoxybacillus tepidamans]|uniref:Xaa-Pro dipeptidase n=1 Tax=Anoxybacteroides tepidamans TaxID=265948 RepID=A0A7W8IQS9_9BACL|nr:Xaa-Pro peptidase family protein [Anoxybacillus tepidamans]MBB5324932.1 Xaa-Pro dipeptidase [Anoxybacillus tepidamans]
MSVCVQRMKKAQAILEKNGWEAVIASSPANFFYFTGTWLDSHERLQAVVIPRTGSASIIVHEMSREEISLPDEVQLILWKDGESAVKTLAGLLPEYGVVAVDNQWPSEKLIDLMSIRKHLSFVKSTPVIGALRLRKDETEIELLRKSGEIADRVMKKIISFVKPGMTEKQVADELKRLFQIEGVERLSFQPIIGAGANGAIPHHQSDETRLTEGDMIVIDMGGIKDHYCSDMTRTIVIGEPTEEMVKVYEIVRKAQDEAVKAIKPGVPMKLIDQVARSIISEAGYGEFFTHRTGHGLGIEVHEEPYLTSNNEQLLEEGMVVSVEPGIYLSGKFGVRIEDIVVVTSNGAERLNHFPRELIRV